MASLEPHMYYIIVKHIMYESPRDFMQLMFINKCVHRIVHDMMSDFITAYFAETWDSIVGHAWPSNIRSYRANYKIYDYLREDMQKEYLGKHSYTHRYTSYIHRFVPIKIEFSHGGCFIGVDFYLIFMIGNKCLFLAKKIPKNIAYPPKGNSIWVLQFLKQYLAPIYDEIDKYYIPV
jgi:hypothetical protein